MKKIAWETVERDTVWVAKMSGWREVGTRSEIGHLAHDEDCRDFDICAVQPAHLADFYDAYFEYEEKHGFTLLRDFYDVYAS